ncbi:MAG: hypothetical protein SCK28_12540 [Bacillota bacterium]|nr:hypothetical protein [Bacillota bacterium]
MNSSLLWKLFISTGSISAYLDYRSHMKREEQEESKACNSQGG